ncbi:MAG: GGDEF domain-containing protein [Candidatus Krumholzibacteriota bacterium]|nr:GGDEF domain-containing protein [Candidatus Krumholzibacteriota bacterium]
MAALRKSSRYFLRHLLPREDLDAAGRTRLESALRQGDESALRALTAELAEVLVRAGRFEKLGGGRYRDRRTGDRFRLPAPPPRAARPATRLEELPDVVVPEEAAAPAALEELPEVTVPQAGADAAPGPHVTAILEAVRLEGRSPGTQAADRLLALLERWHPGSRFTLYRLADKEAFGNSADESLPVLDTATLAPGHPYLSALASGEAQLASGGGSDSEEAWLLAPLRLEDEDWGLLELRVPDGADTGAALESLRLVGEALNHQVHNLRVLSKVVYVDWLTQVFNRSFLELQLPLEIERATRNRETLALLVVDFDDFKHVNDRFGHDIGDQALREFSRVIRGTLRKVDQVFRYGGEEFVVLLPRLDLESAYRAAERLREAVANHAFRFAVEREAVNVTASLGGAIYPYNALGEAALFKAADEAAYEAKRRGKNCVVFSRDTVS